MALHRWGPTPAAGYTAAAIRYPDDTAIVDELGTLTFREVHERTNALAHAVEALYTPLANPVASMAALRGANLIASGLKGEGEPSSREREDLALARVHGAAAATEVADHPKAEDLLIEPRGVVDVGHVQ